MEQNKTKIIHVNRQFIAMNAKDGRKRPTVTMKEGKNGRARYARSIIIHGPSRIGELGTQLSCGARVWIETEADVTLIDEMTFQEAKNA